MNQVIEQLVQIEEAAGNIMENITEQKSKMLAASEKRIKKYNETSKRKLDENLNDVRKEYKETLQREIKHLQEKGKRDIEKLEEQYDKQHHELVQGMVDELTGV